MPQDSCHLQNPTTVRLSTTFLTPRPSPQIPTAPAPKAVIQEDYFSANHSQVSACDWHNDDSLAAQIKKFPLHLPKKPPTKRSWSSLPDIRHLGPITPTSDDPPRLPDVSTDNVDLAACLDQAPPAPPPKDAPLSLRRTRRVKTEPVDSPSRGEQTTPRNRSSWPECFATTHQAVTKRHSSPSSKREWWQFRDSPSPPEATSPPTPQPYVSAGAGLGYEYYTTSTIAELQEQYTEIRWELCTHPLHPATRDEDRHEKWGILRNLVLFKMMQWRFDWGSGKRDIVLRAVGKAGAEDETEGTKHVEPKDVKQVEERAKTAKGWGWARA
ncbi:hypothetical protein FB567DRAFT_554902 [Paraphoma chrysanthemicola]|uniref:Uncharacterized protein n=1 Tax=Paraphoma chrysanthemicola TaxID=798071 RepID=A0A8K0QVB9_9PLEO|nr:hypothetical protein FB567DRAFT_554902 [Paraphoma chrysanthemicola]